MFREKAALSGAKGRKKRRLAVVMFQSQYLACLSAKGLRIFAFSDSALSFRSLLGVFQLLALRDR
jgi:hypothetical protein